MGFLQSLIRSSLGLNINSTRFAPTGLGLGKDANFGNVAGNIAGSFLGSLFGLNNNSQNEWGLSNNDNTDSFSSGKTDYSEEIKNFKPTGNASLDKEMMESLKMLDNPLEN